MKKLLLTSVATGVSALGFALFTAVDNDNFVYANESDDDVETIEEDVDTDETETSTDEETDDEETESEEDDTDVDPLLGEKLFAALSQHEATYNFLYDVTGLENQTTATMDEQYQVEMAKWYPYQFLAKTNQYDDFAEVPEGMTFYMVKPNKMNEHVVFGYNEDRAIVFINPPFIPLYTSMISNGIEFDADELLAESGEASDAVLSRIVISESNFNTDNLTNEHFAKVWKLVKGDDVDSDEAFEVRRDIQYVNPDLRNNSYVYPDDTFEIRALNSEDNLVFTVQPDGGIMVYPDIPYMVVGSDIDSLEATRAALENVEMHHVSDVSEYSVEDIVDQFE